MSSRSDRGGRPRRRRKTPLHLAEPRTEGPPLAVLKFGSSVLRDEDDLFRVADEIRRTLAGGERVLAVVSAMGRSTDELIGRARRLAERARRGAAPPADPEPTTLAALLATGEATSAALLALALDSSDVPATVLDNARVGPLTLGPVLEGEPYELHRAAIRRALDERPVAVLPGFVGRTDEGNVSLLGRGGSDLSALFAAHCLKAHTCRLLKDVDGVYERDPAEGGPPPRRYARLSFDDALTLDDRVVQPKAVRFAVYNDRPFEVCGLGGAPGTKVGKAATRLHPLRRRASRAATGASCPAAGPSGTVASGGDTRKRDARTSSDPRDSRSMRDPSGAASRRACNDGVAIARSARVAAASRGGR